ncbi:MAG: hypothetical protein LAQ30_18185, partial [Acidobacteriia bacterium]|nr:hypothetical protein [Terriglobia bacterium]
MGGIEVLTADAKKLLREFVELPYSLYRGNPHWVPPLRIAVKELLDRKKHPFYANAEAEFFVARQNGRVVGRVAAILDRNHNRFHEEDAGFFGFFEAVNDQAVAGALLSRARQWVFERGAKVLRGPVNPSTNYECGMLIEGFDSSPMIMMSYNPEYYPALMDAVGLRKAKDLYAYYSLTAGVDSAKIDRVAERSLATNGIRVRPIDMKNFEAEVARVWEVYNSAWQRNWGFIPMTREEFFLMGKEMKQILKPDLVLIGEKGGRMVGFALALPDVNQALNRFTHTICMRWVIPTSGPGTDLCLWEGAMQAIEAPINGMNLYAPRHCRTTVNHGQTPLEAEWMIEVSDAVIEQGF